MTIVAYAVGVVLVAAGVALSIALHEIGHLVPAKRFGVKVTQYMVGFGPTVWSRKRGETEYGVKAIPLGGYIRMIGMFPPRPGEDEHHLRPSSTGRFTQLMDQARQDSLEEISPGDEDRVFYKLSVPKKVVVMLGGPFMNLVICAVLLTGVITLYGLPVAQNGAQVASVSECVVPVSAASAADPSQAPTACPAGAPDTPAHQAGLLAGDLIVAVDGTAITPDRSLGQLIQPRAGQPTDLTVRRNGSDITVTLTPVPNTVAVLDDRSRPVVGADGQVVTKSAGFLGITSGPPLVTERQPITAAPAYIGSIFTQTAGVVLNLPQRMVAVAQAAFGTTPRDRNGPMSVVGVGRVGGEIASLDETKASIGDKLISLIMLIASLNMALFVFNLVPLLPLDGGHVAGALWEGLKRTGARVLGRRDPGYVDVAKALPVAYTMAIVLVTMSALLIYADIVRPITLF